MPASLSVLLFSHQLRRTDLFSLPEASFARMCGTLGMKQESEFIVHPGKCHLITLSFQALFPEVWCLRSAHSPLPLRDRHLQLGKLTLRTYIPRQ